MKPKFHVLAISLLAALVLLISACGPAATTQAPPATEAAPEATEAMPEATEAMPEEEPGAAMPEPTVALPEVDPAEYDGTIIAAGSSTVFPLTERMAGIFQDDGFAGNITIDSIGSGAGFERFCVSGETDIANASRAINDGEVESCRAIGREPIEFRVGTDALAVVVSAENDFVDGVTVEELATIFSSDAETWADVNPAWPAEPIQRFMEVLDVLLCI